MTEYLTEQEQIQQLKNWINQYGFTVLAGIVLALVVSFGWRTFQEHQNRVLEHASVVYDEMLTLRAQNNTEGARMQAQKLSTHYAGTPYAAMAALMLAREAVLKKDDPEAARQLHLVIDHGKDDGLREIARIRLARMLLNEKKPEEALALLQKTDDKSFMGLVDEVRGDAFVIENNTTAARRAFQKALVEIPNAEVNRPILQMKYDNLLL